MLQEQNPGKLDWVAYGSRQPLKDAPAKVLSIFNLEFLKDRRNIASTICIIHSFSILLMRPPCVLFFFGLVAIATSWLGCADMQILLLHTL